MSCVRETLVLDSYWGILFLMTKDTTVMLKGYSMNLKMRLSEVYSLPLVKFLNPPTRS